MSQNIQWRNASKTHHSRQELFLPDTARSRRRAAKQLPQRQAAELQTKKPAQPKTKQELWKIQGSTVSFGRNK